jgi:hypothetical protein
MKGDVGGKDSGCVACTTQIDLLRRQTINRTDAIHHVSFSAHQQFNVLIDLPVAIYLFFINVIAP